MQMLGKALFVTKVKTSVSRETFAETLQKIILYPRVERKNKQKIHVF